MVQPETSAKTNRYPISISFNLLLVGWTIIIAGIAFWSYQSAYNEILLLARREAYKGFEKDVMFRAWASMHGGVYVPVSQTTLPNPYLDGIPEREIKTPSGKLFTLMNPAYITRQVHELSYRKSGVLGHITSLNPIRPQNSADKWETEALKNFEKGAKEYSGFDFLNNEKFFRFMAPLITEKECLKCHEAQGYKVGEIRGGISSSVPWKYYEASLNSEAINLLTGYGILWFLGFVGISVVKKRFLIYIHKRDEYEDGIQKLNSELTASKKIIEENLLRKNLLVEELTQTKNSLEKTNSEKDRFFSIIAHDLKSPFMGFIGMTELMADQINSFSQEELTQFSRQMSSSAKNLYKLLHNLLEWAQMQRGGIVYNPEQVNLHEIVSQNIEFLTASALNKGIRLISGIPAGQAVVADKAMLNTILRNLIANGIKFTNSGGEVKVTSQPAEMNFIRISVADSGIGMSEQLVKNLFKMEQRVGRTGTNGEESTGLGLLLCKEFVEKHGGKISAESVEGTGSTFSFTLPA